MHPPRSIVSYVLSAVIIWFLLWALDSVTEPPKGAGRSTPNFFRFRNRTADQDKPFRSRDVCQHLVDEVKYYHA